MNIYSNENAAASVTDDDGGKDNDDDDDDDDDFAIYLIYKKIIGRLLALIVIYVCMWVWAGGV